MQPILPISRGWNALHDGMDIAVSVCGKPQLAKVVDPTKHGELFHWESETHRGYLAVYEGALWVNAGGWAKDDFGPPDPEMLRRIHASFICFDCGKEHEDFGLIDETWRKAWPTEWDDVARVALSNGEIASGSGTLCRECVVKRLGRPLVVEDHSVRNVLLDIARGGRVHDDEDSWMTSLENRQKIEVALGLAKGALRWLRSEEETMAYLRDLSSRLSLPL